MWNGGNDKKCCWSPALRRRMLNMELGCLCWSYTSVPLMRWSISGLTGSDGECAWGLSCSLDLEFL